MAIVVQTVDPLLLLLVPWIANRIWPGARVPTCHLPLDEIVANMIGEYAPSQSKC